MQKKVTLKFIFKFSLKPITNSKTEFKTIEVKTEIQFWTEVDLNNPVLKQTYAIHLDTLLC